MSIETPGAVERIRVVVPAHNEALLIGACLTALQRAVDRVDVPVEVVVVLDACSDATATVIPPGVGSLAVERRNVGAARAAGFASGVRAGTWFATTDADSLVPENWLQAQLECSRRYDLFVGTINIADWEDRGEFVRSRHETAYRRVDGHRHVHGTSLGIRAEAYAAIGGFACYAEHEDVALVEAAERAGYRIDWSAAAPVTTSARRSRRTPGGFSGYLTDLEPA